MPPDAPTDSAGPGTSAAAAALAAASLLATPPIPAAAPPASFIPPAAFVATTKTGISPVAWGIFPALLLLAFIGALFHRSATVTAFKDASSAATYVTGAAIVIERLVEGLWTMVASLGLGSYWPMRGVMHYADDVEGRLSGALTGFVTSAEQALAAAGPASTAVQTQLASLQQDVATYQAEIATLRAKSPPGSQQTLLLSSAVSLRINYLQAKYTGTLVGIDHAAQVAGTLVSGLQNFVATFKDNPGRRLISLCLGGLIGIVVASYLGLDLFTALSVTQDAGGAVQAVPVNSVEQGFRFALTGFIIGLGSGPTHEVIRLLQEYKQSRKGENAAQPDQP